MRREIQSRAVEWLEELEGNQLSVVLLPAPRPRFEGCRIRGVESRNPEWYRELCALYREKKAPKRRRRTAIKRQDTLRGLKELAGGRCRSVYAQRLRNLIEEYMRAEERKSGNDEEVA